MGQNNSSISPPPREFSWLTKDERALRLHSLLNTRPTGPLWVFAFGNGSFISGRRITWHKKKPGLGLCLEKGQWLCKGIAYQLLPENEPTDWPVIWRREMNTGVYNAIWANLNLHTGERVKALTFIVDPTHTQYAGEISIPLMAEIIVGATGKYGHCRDYLASTVEKMAKLGVVDAYLNELLLAVDEQKKHGTV
jgi:cation transport protein ChaC